MAYRPHEFAAMIGKSTSTLRRWDKEGKLVPSRGIGNQRFYTDHDLQKALNIETITANKVKVYCRVSSHGQKIELESQKKAMEQFCLSRGIAVDEWVEEIGGGLNFKRIKFLKLMKSIRMNQVTQIVVAHKDRLARFGFDFIEEFASWYGCTILVANQESLSPQQEIVEDLMAIIHCFSFRLYGLRNYKKEIKKLAETNKLS
jgi:predicted site-specific integrase-resolvase